MIEITQNQLKTMIEQNADADLGEHRHRCSERLAQDVMKRSMQEAINKSPSRSNIETPPIKRMPGNGSFC